MRKIKFDLNNDISFDLKLDEGIFEPTGTTKLLIDAVVNNSKDVHGKKILDLGSGSGVVSISLCKQGFIDSVMFASDLNDNSLRCISMNAKEHNCNITVKEGSLFEPWKEEMFDIIIDDISGVSTEVSKISNWFDGVPCDSGIGGDELTNKVLSQSVKHLKSNGIIFFPVISFSNVESIISTANKYFSNVECVSRSEWILPESMQDSLKELEKLREDGHIRYDYKFGTVIWYTEIYKAYN
jgi:ribosomal protein L11 methylase PrmA